MHITNRLLLGCVLLLLFFSNVYSQEERDGKGNDFWLTFIPNYHGNKYSNNILARGTDSLNIYISSEIPTKGTIRYRDIAGREYEHNFSIPNPNEIYRFKLHWLGFELEGFNDNGNNFGRYQCELPAPQTFHITTDDDVTVFALNQALYSSDAMLVFPTKVLGEDYIVMSYNSDGTTNEFQKTPSQFAVVATEDSTIIQIFPATKTYVNGTEPIRVVLNRGYAYLVQSSFDIDIENPDLTGTKIKSNKPIAVFSGHQRAKLPVNRNGISPSRDMILEQLQPLKNWGRNAFIIPFVQPLNASIYGDDLYRVLVAYDSTEIYINDVLSQTLNSGEFMENKANQVVRISANKPISVAQFKKTSRFFGNDLNVGDPFMLIIPPKEQYLSSYRVINTESWDYFNGFFLSFTSHFLTLIVPDSVLNTVVIDKQPIPANRFRSISNSGYSYVNYSTIAGVHTLEAAAPFGVYVSGFGNANSYGYPGGMNFVPLNFTAPRIVGFDSCQSYKLKFERYSRTDFGIWEIIISDTSNVSVDVQNFRKSADTVNVSCDLIDKFQDGKLTITVSDSLGNTNVLTQDIPGFTIELIPNNLPNPSLLVLDYTLRADQEVNGTFALKNYGKFTQDIKLITKNKELVQFDRTSLSLLPGAESNINYSFRFNGYPQKDTVVTDTIAITDGCLTREWLVVRYLILGDSILPAIQVQTNECDTMRLITVTELNQRDYGFDKYEILNSENCFIAEVFAGTNKIELSVTAININLPAFVSVKFIDLAGNISIYSDTILNQDITIESVPNNDKLFDFGNKTIGGQYCDSIKLINFGEFDVNLKNVRLSKNIHFSVPLSQLPLIIPKKDSVWLYVCFRPLQNSLIYRDSLILFFDCSSRLILLEGEGAALLRDGTSQCDADILMVSGLAPASFFVDNIYPNPISEKGSFVVGAPDDGILKVDFYDYLGNYVLSALNTKITSGLHEIHLSVSGLAQGTYFCVINFNGKTLVKQLKKF